jgi:rod shape-determining protein MreC
MLKKPHYIALVLVIMLVVVLFKLPSQSVAKFKLAISGLFLPLFGLAGSTHELASKTSNTLTSRSELLRQNEQLRRENQELQFRLQITDGAGRENAHLRDLIGWQKQSHWNLKLARVIARDPANWWRSLQIDIGSRDGVRANLAVLTTNGLVGRIQAVGDTRSQVILLGDPSLRVAALIKTNRETGVIMSSSSNPQENNMVDLAFLSGNSAARPGQIVITSGHGGFFSKDIPIGEVVDFRSKDYGLTTEARVKLFANLNSLEDVWVMLPESEVRNWASTATPSPPASHSQPPAVKAARSTSKKK